MAVAVYGDKATLLQKSNGTADAGLGITHIIAHVNGVHIAFNESGTGISD